MCQDDPETSQWIPTKGTQTMTSAEFKIIRRLLGITTDEIAATFNVALRSARRWESSHQPPQGVADWLQDQLAEAKTTVYKMLSHIEAETANDPTHSTTLTMYRTDDEAARALGPTTNKERHAAIMGLVMFLADDELDIHAAYATDEN